MGKYSSIRRRKDSSGFTLVELMVSLAVIAMVMFLVLSTLAFFNQISSGLRYDAEEEATFRRIHLVVQKQIERSDVLYTKRGQVYLMDLENPTLYMDYYRHDSTSGTLYRCKVHRNNLVDIGPGQYSQLARDVVDFTLKAQTDETGEFDGIIAMHLVLKQGGKEQDYDAAFTYPGGEKAILRKE